LLVQREPFLKPELKGKKFLVDTRRQEMATFVPAWGLEKTLDFARRIAGQQPVWVRGKARGLTAMVAGEHNLFFLPNLHNVLHVMEKDPRGNLAYKVLEPIPIRARETVAVLNGGESPYAALLWLEFETSSKAQKILDQVEPYGGSALIPGTKQEELARGKKLSVVAGSDQYKMNDWVKKVVAAYGFPRAETK
jgi:ABC-type Fe3+ transport system substrate-binding protein